LKIVTVRLALSITKRRQSHRGYKPLERPPPCSSPSRRRSRWRGCTRSTANTRSVDWSLSIATQWMHSLSTPSRRPQRNRSQFLGTHRDPEVPSMASKGRRFRVKLRQGQWHSVLGALHALEKTDPDPARRYVARGAIAAIKAQLIGDETHPSESK